MRFRKITFKEYNFDTYLKCRRWIQSLGGDISLIQDISAPSTNVLEYKVTWGDEPTMQGFRAILPVYQKTSHLSDWRIK